MRMIQIRFFEKEYAFFLLYFLKRMKWEKFSIKIWLAVHNLILSVLRLIPIAIPSGQNICEFSKKCRADCKINYI